jgi:hypothetical protein
MRISARWRDSYRKALRACGDKTRQKLTADIAVSACLERLAQIIPAQTPEREEIRTAVADLRILRRLYKKYG